MKEREKNRDELIAELQQLRQKIAALETSGLRLKEETLYRNTLFEQSTDGIVLLTVDGKVYEANQKFAGMLGYTLRETRQLSIFDWEKRSPKAAIYTMLSSADELGNRSETRHTRKDGSEFDVEFSIRSTLYCGKKLLLCICRDSTRRKQDEEQLKESQQLLSAFIDNFRGIAYQVPLSDWNTFSSALFRGAIEPVTGYCAAEFNNRFTWNDIILPEDLPALIQIRSMLGTTSKYLAQAEYRIIHKDGTHRWVRDIAQVVPLGNKQLLHGTIFDITEQKSAEANALRLEGQVHHSHKLEAIGTLVDGVAHDFNNILGIIIGYTNIALSDLKPDTKLYNNLTHVKKASARAREIIQQLLTFSRKVGPKKQPINLPAIIAETVTFLESTTPPSITIDIALPDEKMMVLADPTQMHQVIMNLCLNAREALLASGGTITIRINRITATASSPSTDRIAVTIHDNGHGIPANILDRIFEPYFTTRDTGKGAGMGLAVAHGIIENHGGEITVASDPQTGTTFTVTLPAFIRRSANRITARTSPKAASESILFIDDEEDITTLARLMLEELGFHVTTYTNPEDAVEDFKRNPGGFDLVITDMTMPHMNGEQVFHALKRIRNTIPVIICTGNSSQVNMQRISELGINTYLLKPLNKTELYQIIRTVLDQQHQ